LTRFGSASATECRRLQSPELNHSADHVALDLAVADELQAGARRDAGEMKKILVCGVAGYAPDQRYKGFGIFSMINLDAESVTVGVPGGTLFSSPRFRSGAFDRVFTVGSSPWSISSTHPLIAIPAWLQLGRPCQSGAVIIKPLQNFVVAQSQFTQASVDSSQV